MRHPKINSWDRTLRALFDEVDDYVEEKYGHRYTLHPNRAPRGRTSSKSQDGLFNVGADFSSGYGSALGTRLCNRRGHGYPRRGSRGCSGTDRGGCRGVSTEETS